MPARRRSNTPQNSPAAHGAAHKRSLSFATIAWALPLLVIVATIAACGGRTNASDDGGKRGSGQPRIIGYSSPGQVPGTRGDSSEFSTSAEARAARVRAAAARTSQQSSVRLPVDNNSPSNSGAMRAIWVTRWDYASAADIERIVADCKQWGFDTLFLQVRGEGTVYYRSILEPWAWQLTSKTPATTGRDPGWDPLATAVAAAHRAGLSIHAYINVMPGWKGPSAPPTNARQLWTAHPDWFLVDRNGQRADPTRHYAFLNPALPAVRVHLARVAAEVVSRYAVDGLHLDYIRWPGDVGDFGYSRATQQLFASETGGKSPTRDRAAWDTWRAFQIERTVASIRRAVHQVRPGLPISAAVIADYEVAKSKYQQVSWEWELGRTVDFLVPMNYATNPDTYRKRADFFARRVPHSRLVMGVWPREGWTSREVSARFATAAAMGVRSTAIYSYGEWKKNVRR